MLADEFDLGLIKHVATLLAQFALQLVCDLFLNDHDRLIGAENRVIK